MSSREDRSDAHEALLQAVLCGDRSEDEAEVQKVFLERPALGDRLERLRMLAGRLDALGASDQAALDDALNQPTELDDAVPGLLEQHRPRKRKTRRHWLWGALAAAALLAIAALIQLSDGSVDLERERLGPPARGELRPSGPVDDFDRTFEWNLERPRRGSFRLLVYNQADTERRAPIVDVDVGEVRQWQPDEATVREMNAAGRIVWQVRPMDSRGRPVSGAAAAEAWQR